MKFRYLELLSEFLASISLKIGYFELGYDYDVIVPSYVGCWYLFWFVWKEEAPSYTMAPITCIGGFMFKFTGGSNHPPWEDVLQKKTLVRRGLQQNKTE